ncbi:MAG: DUF4115 domain-containing protein [Alphaproteobacteria bacterium]|nr:DUF4115 domain-containing protein [Alphaproteobacteria bacterium]
MPEQKQKKTVDSKDKKRKKPGGEPAPAQENKPQKSGALLRAARLEKKLDLDEISATINVRVAQLKAIEEGHIDQLPGMTYALGFVKSYATLLKLDPVEIVNKFKAEHSETATKPELNFPEPIPESKMPDPFIIGAAALAVVGLLVAWAVFSGGDGANVRTASDIPPPPPPADTATLLAPTPDTSALTGDVTAPPAVATPATATGAPIATGPLKTPVTPLSDVVGAGAAETPDAAQTAEASAETQTSDATAQQAQTQAQAQAQATVIVPPVASPRPRLAPHDDGLNVINVHRGRSRITLQAKQSSWVQISDASQATIFKRVLRPGDEYFVPDQKGLTMVTSNAGGLEVFVDGKRVQSLGRSGEIIRGIELDPEDLKTKKIRTRY